ncbi:hypothetical protein BC374_24205 [Ensifer sp. LC13]|nr:hypothetical protein BC362_25110 [Ensifer sp. LC14]OCP07081.1 hypothetical protein BC374_24205 [Ensifer sp. LC13]OCP31465.1 hypothetical protein BC364_23450 [Ensifer sp. LC499]
MFKKSTPAAEPVRVPSLTSDPEYGAHHAKQAELNKRRAEVLVERRELERQITETPAPAFRPGVAALLGEASDSTTGQRARLAELNALERDIDAWRSCASVSCNPDRLRARASAIRSRRNTAGASSRSAKR